MTAGLKLARLRYIRNMQLGGSAAPYCSPHESRFSRKCLRLLVMIYILVFTREFLIERGWFKNVTF